MTKKIRVKAGNTGVISIYYDLFNILDITCKNM
jgi:hypothetical protein